MNNEETHPKRCEPEKLEILCKQTGLDKGQIKAFYRAFKQFCPSGAINESTFKNICCQLFPTGGDSSAYAHYFFKAMDLRGCGSLTFSELLRILSCLINGTLKERLYWIFRLYDVNHDGEISRGEMSAVVGSIHDLIQSNREKSESHANYVFQKIDLNADGVITIDEFMTFCFNDEFTRRSFEILSNW